MTTLEQAWNAGAEAQCGQDNGGPMAVNPYTVPKPVPKTREEMSAFAKDWDAKVEAGR